MKAERFTAGVFVFLIGIMMFLSLSSIAIRFYDKMTDKNNSDMALGISKNIAWAELYPFKEAGMNVKSHEKLSSFMSYFHYIAGHIKHKLDHYTSTLLMGYDKIVAMAKKYEDTIAWNMVPVSEYNAVIKLKDGYLTSYTMSLDITHDAEAVKGLSDFCEERGIDFMYINFPAKICKSEDKEISGVLDFTNQNADKLLDMLKEAGVKNYDFRKNLHEAGMKHHESFYVTDHHWKTETGLWAAGEILKILRDDWGWNVKPEILSPEKFDYVIYRDWFLGSQGKKMTLARTHPEDFTMIYPKFETRLHIKIPAVGVNVSGDFIGFYNMEQLKERDHYKLSAYHAYSYGDQALIISDNEFSSNTKRLLVIHDSFSDCVIPFLSLGVRHLDAIDLRHFTGSLKRFVESEKPDAVIVQYNSTMPGRTANSHPSATKEAKKLYDFR